MEPGEFPGLALMSFKSVMSSTSYEAFNASFDKSMLLNGLRNVEHLLQVHDQLPVLDAGMHQAPRLHKALCTQLRDFNLICL